MVKEVDKAVYEPEYKKSADGKHRRRTGRWVKIADGTLREEDTSPDDAKGAGGSETEGD